MAASNQRYTQLLDEYLLLKVSVSEALLRFYKTYPDILVDKVVYDYFQNELVFRFQQHLSSSQRVQLNVNQNQMHPTYSIISNIIGEMDVWLKTNQSLWLKKNPCHGPFYMYFASIIDSLASIHSQLIKLKFLKDHIIAEELENLKSIRKAIDDIDKLRHRINFNKFITPTHIPPILPR